MSFNYDKHKNHEDHGNYWTSYSDLFMGLSVVFLLLYVTASLRTGTNGIQQQMKNQKLTTEVQDLKRQLAMYDNVKKDYMSKQATHDEKKEYEELMDKLSLLQEEAKDERTRLEKEADENHKKDQALNQYQQMVRNIINANMMAKNKIKSRDNIIENQDEEIADQSNEIQNMQQQIQQKEKLIAAGEVKIDEANEQLQEKMADLKAAFKRHQMSQSAYEKKVAQVKQENEKKVEALQVANEQYSEQLGDAKKQLNTANKQLNQTQAELGQKESENKNLKTEISNKDAEMAQQVAALKGQFEAEKDKAQKQLDDEIRKQKLGAAERAKREAALRGEIAKKEKELGDKIGALNSQLKDTEGMLAKARAEADARKNVAKDIAREFDKAGVKADIDMGTGEVVLDFGEAYFENDSARIKARMAEVLKKAMPAYAKSIMSNKKISSNITNVEIVGFASPTYKGRFVDPNSLDSEDRKAFNYNMDLSYSRAKSIMQYMFNTENMSFQYQHEILPLVKVSGRSFLEEAKSKRTVATNEDFCKKYDCKKAQRVIIRFSMDGKKK